MTTPALPGAATVLAALEAGDALAARRAVAAATADDTELLEALARAAASGFASATELLVEQLDRSGIVRRFAGAALMDTSDVDDVAQDSLITVAGSVAGFRGDSAFTSWVHTIVRHRVVDHLRRRRATSPLPPEDLGPAERMSSMIASRATIRAALDDLPELYRGPVVLRDVEGLSYQEVANRLGRGLGTTKSQIARGRAMLAARVRDTLRPARAGEVGGGPGTGDEAADAEEGHG